MTVARGQLARLRGRVSAQSLGVVIALAGLLPPRIRYGYIHPLSRALLRNPVAALPALHPGREAAPEAAPHVAALGDVTCVLGAGALEVGGIGSVVELLTAGLPAQGVTPVVVCTDDGARASRLRAAGVDVHVVHDAESASRALRRIRPDVVQLHGAPMFLIDAARKSAAPLVTVLHNTEIHFSRKRWRSFAQLLASSSAVAVSESVRAFHAARIPPHLRERILVIPNAAARQPAPSLHERRAARSMLERAIGVRLGDDVVFVCLARYDAQKNIAGTVASFTQGLRGDATVRLVIAGAPSDWAEYRRADALRRSSIHADRIHLLGASDGRTLLAAADAFLLNSFFEGWPVAATEAWASGLPLVLSEVGGARELVARDASRSVLVPNPCCESVTDALVERARRRSRHQRNAAALANAVHAVAALARTSPEVRAVPADDVASVADMMQQHAEVLRSAAGVAGATPTGGLRQEEGNA